MSKKYTQNKNAWNSKNYDMFKVFVPKGYKDIIKAYATAHNVSVNRLVVDLIYEEVGDFFDILGGGTPTPPQDPENLFLDCGGTP